jgi:hypothetical protein
METLGHRPEMTLVQLSADEAFIMMTARMLVANGQWIAAILTRLVLALVCGRVAPPHG